MGKLSVVEFLIVASFFIIGMGVFIYYSHKTDELFKNKDKGSK